MKLFVLSWTVLCSLITIIGCQPVDTTGPIISNLATSSKYLAKSDCSNTALTVTANITDDSKIKSAALWYRVGPDQQFTSMPMKSAGPDQFTATVIALEIPGGEYGVVEFSITAEDKAGNQSKSPIDYSVQLLPCVSHE